MSVAAAEHKQGRKPQYKDYVSFLGTYKNGKKDDHGTDSGVSSNNSSSSVYSDLTDHPRGGFREYLEGYGSKRYSHVQPPGKKKNEEADSKTVKTEVYIEINNPPTTITKVVDLKNAQNANSNVSKVSKIFENGTQNGTITRTIPPNGKVNTFNFDQRDAGNSNQNQPRKFQLKKTNSITEKSKVFEDVAETKKTEHVTMATNGCVSPKPPINNAKPVFIPKTVTPQQKEDIASKPNGLTSPPPSTNIKPGFTSKVVIENTKPNGLTSPPPLSNSKPVFASKMLIQQQKEDPTPNGLTSPPPSSNIKPVFAPKAPKPNGFTNIKPVVIPKAVSETLVFQQKEEPPLTKTETPTLEKSAPPPPPLPPQCPPNVPPPPPPPPANFSTKKVQTAPPKSNVATQKVTVNGSHTLPRIRDTTDGPVVDKNDPRVKRLVYGALREMYGSYHDKANDYIATLPRNRVRKNNGLDSIIDSIA